MIFQGILVDTKKYFKLLKKRKRTISKGFGTNSRLMAINEENEKNKNSSQQQDNSLIWKKLFNFIPNMVETNLANNNKNSQNQYKQYYKNYFVDFLAYLQKERIPDPLTTKQKMIIVEDFKKIKGDFNQMKLFLKKNASISIYYKFILYIFENPLPEIKTISYERHHIMPQYMKNKENFLHQEIESESNLIKLTPSLHLYAHILCAYSHCNYQDLIAIKRWKSLNLENNIYNQVEVKSLEYFLNNSHLFFGDYAKQIDSSISEMRKQVARKKSQDSAGNNIKQLYEKNIVSLWAIEGDEEKTEFLIDPNRDQIECPIDLVSKIIDCMPSYLKFTRPINAYTTNLKKYLAGETFSTFNNLKLVNWEQFDFPNLKKDNKRFENQQKVQNTFFKEHCIYYHSHFPKIPFVELNPIKITTKDSKFIVAFIKNLISLTEGAGFDTSSLRTTGFYSLLNGEKKSWANWHYFSYSELKKNETVESHIYSLINKNSLVSNHIHLNQNNIYYHWNFPYVPYLEVSPFPNNTGTEVYFDSLADLATKLKILTGIPLDNLKSPSNKELSKLIRQKIKSCGGWKFFSKSELKENESIESHIVSLNKKNFLPWQYHLNTINIYYHDRYPEVPYLIVKPGDYLSLTPLVNQLCDLLNISNNDASGISYRKLFQKAFSLLVNQSYKSYYGWQYFNLNNLKTSIENPCDFIMNNGNFDNVFIIHRGNSLTISQYIKLLQQK